MVQPKRKGETHVGGEAGGGSEAVGAERAAGRYPCRIPIRMTRAERALIGQSACAAHLSVSRYLVQAATCGRPARPEERARLHSLQTVFQQAAEAAHALLGAPPPAPESADVRVFRTQLAEVGRLLAFLSEEVGRRLSESEPGHERSQETGGQ